MYEAYVTAEQEPSVNSLGGCEGVDVGRVREVPVRVMRELESVLAVRSEARERRREQRRRRGREECEVSPPQPDTNCLVHKEEVEVTNEVKSQSESEQVVMATAYPRLDVLQSDWVMHTDHTPTVTEGQAECLAPTGTRTNKGCPDSAPHAIPAAWFPGNLTSELASMAAAVAAGSRRSKVAEVFDSNHDNSCSD